MGVFRRRSRKSNLFLYGRYPAKMTQRANPLALLLIPTSAVWLILLASGRISGIVGRVSSFLPPYAAEGILILLPIVAGLCVLNVSLSWKLRFVLYLFLIVCCTLLPIAWSKYPILCTITVVWLYAEVFWILPRINEKMDRQR